jgi:hypothetical protein
MPIKPRKNVKAAIKKEKGEDVQTVKGLTVDPRPTRFVKETNRYDQIIEARKAVKREREEKKLAKPHIGNKKRIQNRWKAEAEADLAANKIEEEEE